MRSSYRNVPGNKMRVRDWVISVSALLATAFAVLAVGGVLRWTQAIVAALVAVGVGGTILSRHSFARMSPLLAALGIAIGLTLLQLIPLPNAILDLLSPATAALRADGAELLGTAPWRSLSGDASASLGALIGLVTLLGIAVIALRLSASERGRYRVLASIAALTTLAAIITGVHKLVDATALYGVYEPQYVDPVLLGPLLNSNNLACLMAVGAMLSIGLAAHRRQRGWLRVVWLLCVAACGAVSVATISRGGTLAMLAGSVVTIGVLIAQRLASPDRSRARKVRFFSNALPLGILAGCLVVLVIYANATQVEKQFAHLSFDEVQNSGSKFVAWRAAGSLIEEAPWLGIGRGAFASAFPRVHDASGVATYSYLENEYLQAVVDWGIPGALALVLAMLWFGYAAARRWRDTSLVAGALGAIAVVAVQSSVDFGLELLGLAAPVTAIAATLAYVPLREARHPKLARGLRVAHVLALGAGATLLLTDSTRSLDEDRHALSTRASLESVRKSSSRHPLDYYAYAVAAEILDKKHDRRAVLLLNHAMTLHPTHPQLHRLAAHMLLDEGYSKQAAVEYAAAMRTTPQPRALLVEILARLPQNEAAAALPTDYSQPQVLVTTLNDLGRPEVARAWLTRTLQLGKDRAGACELMFILAQRGDKEAAASAGAQCSDRLPDYQTRLSLARLLVSQQAYAEAIRLLRDVDTWQARRDDKIDAWLVSCDAQLALGFRDDAKRCLRRLDASPDMLDERRAEILKRLDAIHSQRDDARREESR